MMFPDQRHLLFFAALGNTCPLIPYSSPNGKTLPCLVHLFHDCQVGGKLGVVQGGYFSFLGLVGLEKLASI